MTVPGLSLDANSGSSRVISVAIGDFDGDGQNEIALATAVKKYVTENGVTTSDTVELSLFRYVHNSLTDTPSLKLVSSTDLLVPSAIPPSISLVAGNFTGSTNNRAQLILADAFVDGYNDRFFALTLINLDSSLIPAPIDFLHDYYVLEQQTNPPPVDADPQIKAVAGLFRYDPTNGFDLYRRQIAVAYDLPVVTQYQGTGSKLEIQLFQVSSDAPSDTTSITPLFDGQRLELLDSGGAGEGSREVRISPPED